MSKPEFVILSSERTPGGALHTAALRRIRSKLQSQGFILLPSDTCYSLAAYAAFDNTHRNINTILSRGDDPISLCAANYEEALRWIDARNYVAQALLEHFTPGPITVVCAPSASVRHRTRFFNNTIGDTQGQIGIRIPDSFVERDVSATNSNYLITTTAVRDPQTKAAVTSFEKALDIVQRGIAAFGGAGWGAIQGNGFSGSHSTVVIANRGGVKLIRAGAIAFDDIKTAATIMPSTVHEDWS